MAKIIDTHSHILPGIDDGAGSWKEALCMLKTAQAQGIRRVIATPHWGGPFGYTDPVQIRELCFTLQEKARRHNISVKIYQGQAEVHTDRMRLTFRNITVTGVCATTLTFSTAPGAQANAAANVCPGPALDRI